MSHVTEREALCCRLVTFEDQILIKGINTSKSHIRPSVQIQINVRIRREIGSNPAEITDEPVCPCPRDPAVCVCVCLQTVG